MQVQATIETDVGKQVGCTSLVLMSSMLVMKMWRMRWMDFLKRPDPPPKKSKNLLKDVASIYSKVK